MNNTVETVEISRRNPGCLVFLIDQSGSMSDPISGGTSGKTKAQGVADAINKLLRNLVLKCSKPEVRDYFDVAVIGYGAAVGPAFEGALAGRPLVKTSEIAKNQFIEEGMGGPVKPFWFRAVANGGTPMCGALSLVQRMLTNWVADHPASYPPLVINITDGEPTDGDPAPIAEQIRALATTRGAVLVCNCHISASAGKEILYPCSDKDLPDDQARRLFQMSSEMPASMRGAAGSRRGREDSPLTRRMGFCLPGRFGTLDYIPERRHPTGSPRFALTPLSPLGARRLPDAAIRAEVVSACQRRQCRRRV